MPKKRTHRICVYMLDAARRNVLLQRAKDGPYTNQYAPMTAPWSEQDTLVEIARRLVSRTTDLDFLFLGYSASMPMVLDERSIRLYPPFHIQLTVLSETVDLVDYVYLVQAKAALEFPEGGPLCWFNQSNIKNMPAHVAHLVHHILTTVTH